MATEPVEVEEVLVGFLDSDLSFQTHKSVQYGDKLGEVIAELTEELTMLGSNVFSVLVVFRFKNGAVNSFSEISIGDLIRQGERELKTSS